MDRFNRMTNYNYLIKPNSCSNNCNYKLVFNLKLKENNFYTFLFIKSISFRINSFKEIIPIFIIIEFLIQNYRKDIIKSMIFNTTDFFFLM